MTKIKLTKTVVDAATFGAKEAMSCATLWYPDFS